MKPRAEQGRNQAPLAKKLSRDVSGCEMVTYVRNTCRHRCRFHRDASPETMPPHIWYTYLYNSTRCPRRTYYLIHHVCKNAGIYEHFNVMPPPRGGWGPRNALWTKRCRATREHCIHRPFKLMPPPKTLGTVGSTKCAMEKMW